MTREDVMVKNYINFLARAMKNNGCTADIRTEEDILNYDNLYYLSKEDSRGSRYIPLQYKRMLEKIILGVFSSSFEYTDKEDVYIEKIGETLICTANVRLVSYQEDGSKRVLGHGFHSLSLDEIMPGEFLSEAQRISRMKATVIGGAKSRALYDAGIGLEFYGDVFAPEENLDEHEVVPIAAPKSTTENPYISKPVEKEEEITSEKKESNPEMSDLGLPIPKPKRGRPRKDAAATVTAETTAEVPTASTHVVPTTAEEPASVQETVKAEEAMEVAEMSMDVAKAITADLGNYKGMSLGKIYEVAPKNLIFLVRHSTSDDVQRAAKIICKADPVLSERFEI